ncbi:MAG: gliding motility-associated C-terminal domain-containing protein [Bacteroidales bacterium]|nr:gliding motility-associated C-terminal domain-containing protein [Bacteroidales bacterium]
MKKLISLLIIIISVSCVFGQGSGNGMNFSGASKTLYLISSSDIDFAGTDDFTISGWFYFSNNSDFQTIFDKTVNIGDNGKFNIHIDVSPASRFRFNLNQEGYSWEQLISNAVLPDNTWIHFACVKQLNISRLYINGVLDNSLSLTNALAGTSNAGINVNIGRLRRTSNFYYKGSLDEICIYRTALPQSTIQEWMCKTVTASHPYYSSLVSYLKMNEGSGTSCFDASGSGNHAYAIVGGAPLWIVSGAAIGDDSEYKYPVDWTGLSLVYTNTVGDELTLSDISSAGNSGAHIYYVGSNPNSSTGISDIGSTNSYYGVYLTDFSGNYSVEYNYADFTTNCDACNPLYARNDNSVTAWSPISASHASCTSTAVNESSVSQVFRSEYFVSIQDLEIDLGSDSEFCEGNSQLLDATLVAGSSYLWNDASTNPTLSVNTTGLYDVIVSFEGCTLTDEIDITVNPNPTLSLSGLDILCTGNSTGEITSTVSSGTSPYNYLWDNSSTSADLTGVSAGTYVLTVTDDNSCTVSDSYTLTEPATALSGSISVSSDVVCYGESNGSATITATGGVGPYTYLWSNGQTSENLTGVIAGDYSVVVTDFNGCTFSSSVTITEPAELTGIISGQNISCNGAADGEVSIAVTGGTGSYYYNWSSGGSSDTETNLGPGTYFVTVIDDNSCSFIESVTITQPQPLSLSFIFENVSCFGLADGVANASAGGGTSPYTYSWSSGGSLASEGGLVAGNYSLTLTDDNGCSIEESFTITEPNLLELTIDKTDVLCFGDGNGTAEAIVTGGTSTYSYLWSNTLTSSTITNLGGGNYSVTVTDQNSCTVEASVEILEPAVLEILPSQTNASCYGFSDGIASVVVSGGTLPYSYLWSGGETTDNISGLIAGHYNLTVTDANNCEILQTITITEPNQLLLNFDFTSANCGNPDGTATVNPTGGTSPYTYQWDASAAGQTTQTAINLIPGNYSVTVSDINSCSISGNVNVDEVGVPIVSLVNIIQNPCYGNSLGSIEVTVSGGGTAPFSYSWSSGGNSELETGLAAGTYEITVTDVNSCSASQSFTITEPLELNSAIINVTNLLCYGDNSGSAEVVPSGGTAPYSYLWSDAGSTSTDVLSGVPGGWYFVSITDLNNCTTVDSIEIFEPENYYLTFNTMAENCGLGDGTAAITPVGGTPGYTYFWETTDTDSLIIGLASGNYSVTVTDNNNCTLTQTVFVDLQGVGDVSVNLLSGIKCYNEASGSLAAAIVGGTAPYSFSWSNGSTNDTLTMLMAGYYFVTITDGNNCVVTDSMEITQPDQIMIDVSIVDVMCYGDSTGSAIASVSGGTPPYNYLWSNGQTDTICINMQAGGYSITVTDDNNCIRIRPNIGVFQPDELIATIDTVAEILCYGSNEGVLEVSALGGTIPYSYLWENGDTSHINRDLPSGSYTVTITDANLCKLSLAANLTQPIEITIATDTILPASCLGNNDGYINISAEGGTGEFSYLWSNGNIGDEAVNLSGGIYYVTVSDINSCAQTAEFTVGENSGSCIEIPTAFTPNNDGVNDYFEIENVHLIEEIEIEIYNRWGQLMFNFIGTGIEYSGNERQWDGTYNGEEVAFGSYIYIVKLSSVETPYNGVVTIVR